MRKQAITMMAAIVMGALSVSAAVAVDQQGTHRGTRHHPYVDADPAARGGYVMNGNFDWRRRNEPVPWYGQGYSDDCVAWTYNAYHYACDPNARY
jgi:hypothetical protein